MNGNNQNASGQKPKEEKEFLARDEVKTMEKDVSRLREVEANKERERVSRIKTEEEIIRERARQEQAKRASLERASSEKEAQEREERIKKMREEREVKENVMAAQGTQKETFQAEQFRNTLKETQMREDEERKRFMARVEAQAGGKETPAPLSPFPPVMPPVPPRIPTAPAAPAPTETGFDDSKNQQIPEPSIKKPSSFQKLFIRIILSLLGLALIAVIATFIYWYLAIRENPQEKQIQETPEKELVIPPAPFLTDNSQTLKINQASEIPELLAQVLTNEKEPGVFSRIIIEDVPNTRVLGLKGFFETFATSTPEDFYNKLADDFTLFSYSQEEGNRIGLVVKTNSQTDLNAILASWEGAMEKDLDSLFAIVGKDGPALAASFKDGEYQNINFRFQTFSRKDLGIVYAFYNNYFILTTSWKSMEQALDRLKAAPVSFFLSPDSGAEFILASMTLREKIGQLFFMGIDGTNLTPETGKLIENVRPGGILLLKRNVDSEAQTKKLVQDLQQASLSSHNLPLLIGVDQEGGAIATINFGKEKTSQSEISDTEQAFEIGRSRGEELKNLGINLNLAPVLDSAQPGDFLFNRVFKNIQEAGSLVKALILGQKEASILTAVKHFPGYGDITFNPEDELAVVDKTPEIALFKQAAEARPEFVMTSNVVYSEIDPDFPFSFSAKGIALLKDSLGRGPLIITDDLPQPSLIDRFSLKGVVTLPILAGADILTFSNNWETTLESAAGFVEEAVKNKEISEARINKSVLKIIKLKKSYYGK